MSEKADVAAARARARTGRWAVGAAAACVALAVSGVLAWNALDRDGTETVLVIAEDPSVPDPVEPQAVDGPGPSTGAASAGASDAGGVAEADADEPLAGVEQDEATGIEEEEDPAEPKTPTPEEMSTGPVLDWTEFDPGIAGQATLQSVGDGRVLALAWPFAGAQDYGGAPVDGPAPVLVTTNGTDWTEVPMPDGVNADQVEISGDRWLVVGSDTGPESLNYARFGPSSSRVFFSDDQGTTWTELHIDLPADPTLSSPWLVEHSAVTSALVSGERIVLAAQSLTTVDAQALLTDRGLLPDGKEVFFWHANAGGEAVFTMFNAPDPDDPSRGTSPPDEETLELRMDDLGLTADEQAVLSGPDSSRVNVLSSDGSTVELVAQYDGFGAVGVSTGYGFELTLFTDTGLLVLTSPDGRRWSEKQSSWDQYSSRTVVAGGTIWSTVSNRPDGFSVQRGDDGQTPTTVATIEGLAPAGDLTAGPAGVTVLAITVDPDDSAASGALVPEGRVAKDGYELRFNEPEGGLTLWDLAEDAAVYEFGPEIAESETTPDGTREIDDDGSFGVVFEDPETGADLVTFTEDDLNPIFESSLSEGGGMYEAPETWVGWSADGAHWGWQTVAGAFAIDEDEGEPWAQFAVGRDFVIAKIQTFQRPELAESADGPSGILVASSDEARPPRWFIARVP